MIVLGLVLIGFTHVVFVLLPSSKVILAFEKNHII